MRLDKFLVDCGLGSRSEVKDLLKGRQIRVNGQVAKSAKGQIDPEYDRVFYGNQLLTYERFVYYLLNKPAGVISATEDSLHETVLDLLDDRARQKAVFPVGRLDIDTTGLLLLTNNGQLAHAMLSPKKHVAKYYRAQVAGLMTEDDVVAFAAGIKLKDFTCQPAKLELLSQDEHQQTSLVGIEIMEGKFHQVKRMVAACGKEVVNLERLSMGPLQLDANLARGDFRRLTAEELTALESFGQEL